MSSTFQFSAVERLFARLGLGPVRTVEPLSGGQLNTALRVDKEHVLRYREAPLATGSLKREAAVLERLGGRIPAATVVTTGTDDLLGEFIVQKWVPGQNLLRAWLENPDVGAREYWIAQWLEAVRGIHDERFQQPGEFSDGLLKSYPSWRNYVEARIRKRLDLLMRVPAMDRELILVAERYVRRQAPVLEDGPFCLIHRDLHFANVLVDGPNLTAILDFELAEVGTPDYELDTIFRFLRYPSFFAEPAVAARVTPTRFASVWGRLKRGCPEMFQFRHLRERLCLYALDRDLSCLHQIYVGRPGSEQMANATIRRLEEVLQGRYGPDEI